jgi:hypothetical protein
MLAGGGIGMRKVARFIAVLCLLAAVGTPALGADVAEISFWETVRDSKNPAELQAYLDRYPQGDFAVLARARLAALGQKPPPVQPTPRPQAAPTVISIPSANGSRLPMAGDTWTYRVTYPRLRGQWGQTTRPPGTYVVRVGTASERQIIDQLSIDGGSPLELRHAGGHYVSTQGLSLFSPYLAVFETVSARQRLASVESLDEPCGKSYRCDATARVAGKEAVIVPAGQFEAIKVIVEQQWAPFSAFSTLGSSASDMNGGRTLTVWYSPEVKRAVKYSSRLISGVTPPMDANFDLELISYQLK